MDPQNLELKAEQLAKSADSQSWKNSIRYYKLLDSYSNNRQQKIRIAKKCLKINKKLIVSTH